MSEIEWYATTGYTLKCRLYPNKECAKKIDQILHALHVYHNNVLYDIRKNGMHQNERDDKDNPGKKVHYPDFAGMKKPEFYKSYMGKDPRLKIIPAANFSNMANSIIDDMEKAHKKTGNHPIEQWGQTYLDEKGNKITKGIKYYTKSHPRGSFFCRIGGSAFKKTDNHNVFKVRIPNVGIVKVRGWNQKLRFDENHQINFIDYVTQAPKKQHSARIIKDKCGDYYITITFANGKKTTQETLIYIPTKKTERLEHVGIDIGERYIAVASNGEQFPGFLEYKDENYDGDRVSYNIQQKEFLNTRLSAREGWSNEDFRERHKADRSLQPSKRYLRTQQQYRKINRKITRQREHYYHNVSKHIALMTNLLGTESLNVADMKWRKEQDDGGKEQNE